MIWIQVNSVGEAARAVWNTTAPGYGSWFGIDPARLIHLNGWLMRNCLVGLGDRVWQQVSGIPMGFACSPLWCNMYLLFYETRFIMRLVELGRCDLLEKFQHAYRYIDDLCWFNTGLPLQFLSPNQPRVPENPFWIYPLDVLEIKCEVQTFDSNQLTRGIHAYFMNMEIRLTHPEQDSSKYELCKYDK